MHIRRFRYFLYPLAGVFALGAASVVAPSQSQAAECGRHEMVAAFLGDKYKEQVKAMGLVSNKGFMQLYVAKSGTWTVLLTTPEGISCIIAAGDSYELAPVALNDPNA